MGIETGTLLLIGVAAGGTAYMVESQRKQASKEGAKGRKTATAMEKKRRQLLELQAGEYEEIAEKQMTIQALQSQTRTLVEVLDQQEPAPRIFTLPTAQSTDPVRRINRAIDDFVRGRYG